MTSEPKKKECQEKEPLPWRMEFFMLMGIFATIHGVINYDTVFNSSVMLALTFFFLSFHLHNSNKIHTLEKRVNKLEAKK